VETWEVAQLMNNYEHCRIELKVQPMIS